MSEEEQEPINHSWAIWVALPGYEGGERLVGRIDGNGPMHDAGAKILFWLDEPFSATSLSIRRVY